MSGQIRFETSSMRNGGRQLEATASEVVSRTEALLAEVSDPAFLGTNDTLGGIASMLYSLVVERVKETVDSVKEGYSGHGRKLQVAADIYDQAESDNAAAASGMVD